MDRPVLRQRSSSTSIRKSAGSSRPEKQSPAFTPPAVPRYKSDFEEIKVVGHGGFGEVVMARNRLDGRVYAIKKIQLKKKFRAKIIREVVTLSRLYHKNVIRYYQSWIEIVHPELSDASASPSNTAITSTSSSGKLLSHNPTVTGDSFDDDFDSLRGDDDWLQESIPSYHVKGGTLMAQHHLQQKVKEQQARRGSQERRKSRNVEDSSEMLDFKASGDWDFEHGDDVFGFQLESATSVANSHISKHINVSAKRDLDDEDDYSDVSFSDTRRAPRRDQAHSWDEECDLCGDYYTDWEVPNEFWDKLTIAVRSMSLCPSCYAEQLNEAGVSLGKISMIVKAPQQEPPQYLYIQMDYCQRTLRHVIDEGTLFTDDLFGAWKIFGQILEGLVYIHQKGIVHRDLKPTNIFLDQDEVRIGDFGLATTVIKKPGSDMSGSMVLNFGEEMSLSSTINVPDSGRTSSITLIGLDESVSDSSMTNEESESGAVGTHLYTAPEGGSGTKGDMYSLGILLFEMCFRFGTRMERVVVLEQLRQHELFPEAFEREQKYSSARKIIRWLLQRQPDDRPSALELLNSKLLPSDAIQDNYVDKIVTALAAPESAAYARIMDALFSQDKQRVRHQQSTLPHSLMEDVLVREMVLEQVTQVFQRHGATKMSLPWIDNDLDWDSFIPFNDCAHVLFTSGTNLSLPYDLRLSFAKHLPGLLASRSNPCKGQHVLKRYDIGPVYRKSDGQGHPRQFFLADFDIAVDKQAGRSSTLTTDQAPISPSLLRYDATKIAPQMRTTRDGANALISPPQVAMPAPVTLTSRVELRSPSKAAPAMAPRRAMTPQFNSASPDTHEDELLRPSSSEPGLESDNRLLSVSMPDDRFLQLAESQGTRNSEAVLAEAEVLKVTTEVMAQFKNKLPNYFLRINHVHILEAIFDACEIEESDKMRNRLASIITNSSRIPWSTVQAQLIREGGLSEPKTEELRQFLHFKGEPNRLLSQLGSHFTNFGNRAPHVHQKAKRAISHLYKMLAALSEFGVDSQIVMFDPTLSLTGEYKVGLVFQVLVAMGDKKLNCVAVGGRYDALVSDFEQKRASVPQPAMDGCSKDGYPVRPISVPVGIDKSYSGTICVVGVSFAIDKLLVIMRKLTASRAQVMSQQTRQLDAFVISSASLFTERLNMVSQLWQKNIRCEYVYDNASGLDEQERLAKESGARFLLRLKQDSFYITGLVDVIDTAANSLKNISRGEVAEYLATALVLPQPTHQTTPVLSSSTAVSVSSESTHFSKGRKEQQIRANLFSRLGMMHKKHDSSEH